MKAYHQKEATDINDFRDFALRENHTIHLGKGNSDLVLYKMLNFCIKSYNTSVYRTLGDKKSDSKCVSALKFLYPWKPVKFSKHTHAAYGFIEGLRQRSGGYYAVQSWQIAGSCSASTGVDVFLLLSVITEKFRNLSHDAGKKTCLYIYRYFYLSEYGVLKPDIWPEKTWETISVFSPPPQIFSYVQKVFRFSMWADSDISWLVGENAMSLYQTDYFWEFEYVPGQCFQMYNCFKGKEHKNLGKKESSTDIWSVYIAKDQYSDKIKGIIFW